MSLKIDPFGINNTGFIIGPFGFVGDGVIVTGGGGGSSATRNLKLGSTVIEGVYLGSSQLTHVYIGSNLIWSQA
tara:strand:+ start:4008 stop:4229 length:222 start_codon:yes stop_codon:yes gene_type:complete